MLSLVSRHLDSRPPSAAPAGDVPGRAASGPSDVLVVFDLDGTLIDSRRDLADSTNEVVESYGGQALPIDRIAGMIGEGAKLLVQRALAASGLDPDEPDALERFHAAYAQRLTRHTRPYEGIAPMLERLAVRAALAVLTNKPSAATERVLAAFDLGRFFRWTLGGDSPFGRKPDPAGLRHLMAAAGASADRTLFVGDSMIDVETARQGGVEVVVALYGFGQARGELALEPDDRRVETSTALAAAIDDWVDRQAG
jgi:phosphoglycolate phosphatase